MLLLKPLFIFVLFSISTASAKVTFAPDVGLDSPNGEHFIENHLLNCQKGALSSRPNERRVLEGIFSFIEEKQSVNLTDSEKGFIAANPFLIGQISDLREISTNFVELVCGNFIHDSTQTDIFQHVAFSLVAAHRMGFEKACAITTYHEERNIDEIKNFTTKDLELSDGLILRPAERMDLINNKVALQFYRNNAELVRKCVTELEQRRYFRESEPRVRFSNYNYSKEMGKKVETRFQRNVSNLRVNGSCLEIAEKLINDRSHDLVYILSGSRNQCSNLVDSINETSDETSNPDMVNGVPANL